jgi:predicted nucleic acid-binding protein
VAFVTDASITVAWCIEDERSEQTDALFLRATREGVVVPPLWSFEIANVLLLAEKRGRVRKGGSEASFAAVAAAPIEVDMESSEHVFGEILSLGRRHGLTIYDATYLELAIRTGLPLATLDQALAAAARQDGVELLVD